MVKNFLYVMVLFLAGWYPAWHAARPPLKRLMGQRFLVGYTLTIAAGFFAPNIWLYHLALIAAFLGTTTDREDAIMRYVTMIALSPAVTTVIIVGPLFIGTFNPTMPATVAMLIAHFVKPSRDRTPPVRGWRAEDSAVAALFLIFSAGATRLLPFTPLLRQMLMTTFDIVIPYWLVRQNLRSPERLRLTIGCMAITAIAFSVVAVYERKFNWPLYDGIQARLSMMYGLSAFTLLRGGAIRAICSFSSPLLLAYFLMLGMIGWLCSRDLFKPGIIWKGGIAVLAIGILAPQSRGVLVALAPGLVVLLICRRRFALAAATLGAAGIGAVALFALQHFSPAIAAFVGGHQEGEFYDYRGLLLHRGMQEGMKHPILGQSIESVTASLQDITQGEHIVDFVNSYLTMFLIGGIVGLLAFVIPALMAVRKLIARARRGEMLDAVRSNRAFVVSTLVATYIYIYSVSFVERMELYPVLLLAMARMTSGHLLRRAPPQQQSPLPTFEERIEEQRFPERLVPA